MTRSQMGRMLLGEAFGFFAASCWFAFRLCMEDLHRLTRAWFIFGGLPVR